MRTKPRVYRIPVSSELLEELSVWSEPVQVRVTRGAGGGFEMQVRRVESASPEDTPCVESRQQIAAKSALRATIGPPSAEIITRELARPGGE